VTATFPRPAWRHAAAAISLLWLATLAAAVMLFFSQALLARRLGPEAYGLFASSLATVSLVAPLAGFGLAQFRLKAYGAEGWHADRWLPPSLRFSVLSTLVAMAMVVAWAGWGPPVSPGTRIALLLLTPMIAGLLAVELVGSKLRLEERHRALAAWQLLVPGGRLLVAMLVFVSPALGVVSAATGYALVALLVVALALPQVRAMLRGRMALQGHGPRPSTMAIEPPRLRELWDQAWPYGLAAVLYPVFFQVGTVLLKYLRDDAQAGRYGLALSVMTALYLFPSVIYQKFLLARLHRWAVHDPAKFWRVHRQGTIVMLGCGLATGLVLATLARPLVPLLFGVAYAPVADVLMVLALCVPLRFTSTAVGSALLTADHMRYRVRAMLGASLLAIVLCIALIPRFGELGAAASAIAAELALLLLMWRGVRRVRLEVRR
jgi:O-antigen/teichoic acid export membrane protein